MKQMSKEKKEKEEEEQRAVNKGANDEQGKDKGSGEKNMGETNKKDNDEQDNNVDDVDDVDSDEETDAQRLRRIQRQKEEERRRRELEEESRQALTLSVERFAAPEILFRPDDVGLDHGGIAEMVIQSVQACPPALRAAMYRNVLLTGGNALVPGFAQRLERELRSLAPSQYEVRVFFPEDPVTYAWKGARQIAAQLSAEVSTCKGAEADATSNVSGSGGPTTAAAAFQACFVDRVQWEAGGQEPGNIWKRTESEDGMVVL